MKAKMVQDIWLVFKIHLWAFALREILDPLKLYEIKINNSVLTKYVSL